MQASPRLRLFAPTRALAEFLLNDLRVNDNADLNDVFEERCKGRNAPSKGK